MGSFGMHYNYATGKTTMSGDQGPRTHHCVRCRAREALERDGIEYAKDDRAYYVGFNGAVMNPCCVPSLLPEGVVTITSGSAFTGDLTKFTP